MIFHLSTSGHSWLQYRITAKGTVVIKNLIKSYHVLINRKNVHLSRLFRTRAAVNVRIKNYPYDTQFSQIIFSASTYSGEDSAWSKSSVRYQLYAKVSYCCFTCKVWSMLILRLDRMLQVPFWSHWHFFMSRLQITCDRWNSLNSLPPSEKHYSSSSPVFHEIF